MSLEEHPVKLEDDENRLSIDKTDLNEKPSFNIQCFFFAGLASFMLGTKMMLISYVELNEYWIFFIEHMAIWITSCVVIALYLVYKTCTTICCYPSSESGIGFKIFGSFKQMVCAFMSGFLNATGNVFIIFALKSALQSGTNPSTISSILMFNVLIILIAGVTLFKERHKCITYIGGVIVFVSLLVIATHHSFDDDTTQSENKTSSYNKAIFYVC